MANLLPFEVIYIIVEDLPISDLLSLNCVSPRFRLFFKRYFTKIKHLDDPLLPLNWPPLQKYAALESRRRIFPETLNFLDITTLLCRCLEREDNLMFNYFWERVIKEEERDLWSTPVN